MPTLADAVCVRPFTMILPWLRQARAFFPLLLRPPPSFGAGLRRTHRPPSARVYRRCGSAQQHPGNHFQKRVACLVATGIVDILELVKIKKQQRARVFVAGGKVQHLFQLFLEAAAVVQIGQRIVMSQPRQSALGYACVRSCKTD